MSGRSPILDEDPPLEDSLIRAFGKELLDKLDPWICSELSQKWRSFHEGIVASEREAEKERLGFQQSRFELEAELTHLRTKLEGSLKEAASEEKELSQVRIAYSEARRKLGELEEVNTNLNMDNGSLRRERDAASSERSELADLAERRQAEIDRLHGELKTLSEKLLASNTAKCEALVRAEEVESKEVSLKYKEQRMEEERNFLNTKISSLTSELEGRHEELLSLKREQSHELAGIQSDLSYKTEEMRHFEAKESALKEDVTAQMNRAEELAKRLKMARDSESLLEENFRQELEAQTKLAQIYKDHAEEEKEKHKELEGAILELQSLLKSSSEKYGVLEAKLEKSQADNGEELKKRNEAIKSLKSELENANGLIKNINTKGLSAEGIENLSPSAAAASRLIKSGMTLTQIYAQLVAVNEELIMEKDETKRLNTYLDQILVEIEERAPILKQQRDDYERVVSTINRLTERIEEAQEEVDLRKREASEASRRLGGVLRENERLCQQVKDLSQQIVTLVKEVEALRSTNNGGGGRSSGRSTHRPESGSDADSVISSNLVSFGNIEELQARNAELLSVVRELSDKVETVETHLVEEKTSELRKELMDALQQVEELKEARLRQEAMVDNIISQRDMYKSVADQKEDRKPAKWVSPEVEKKLLTTEATLKEISKEFEVYRTEKCENEKMLLGSLENTNKELSESRSKAAKLASQEEYNTERFKILQNNSKSYVSQISILEERNRKLGEVVSKHEASLSALRDSVFGAQTALSKAELKVDRITHENGALKAAEARYTQEREVFYRERKSSALVSENLKQIQLHLERDEDEAKMRLQNANDALSKEISLLRKKVEADSEAFKESVRAWENTQKELRSKLEEAGSRESLAQEEIKTLTRDIEELRKELKEANEKLELAGRRPASNESPAPQQPPTSGKIRDLELLLNTSKNEVKSLKDQLVNARQAVSQFKDLANSAEKRLTESSTATKVFREDYERRLQEAEVARKTLESNLEELKSEQRQRESSSGIGRSDNDLRQEISSMGAKLRELTEKYDEARRIKEEAQKSLEEQSVIASETQSKYERELLLHAQNVALLQKAKEDLLSREDKSSELRHAKELAEEKLAECLQDRDASEKLLRSEYSSLKEQFTVLEAENKAVHDRLADVTTQITSLRSSDSGEKSFSEEEAEGAPQLMQIIKYLRKEKEILLSKSDILTAELSRVGAQKKYVSEELEQVKDLLSKERESSSAEAKSASKHFQLVQKVETLSALSDSNRLLRDEKDKMNEELGALKVKLSEAFESCNPLKEKISSLETKSESLNTENVALRGEATRWRQRATQLIEKSNKVNPEELKKFQGENVGLKKQVAQLNGQVRQNTVQVNNLTAKLRATEERASNDIKAKVAEISKLMQEKNALNMKNNNLLKRVTELEGSLKAAKAEAEKFKTLDPGLKTTLEASISSLKEELDKLKEETTKREKEVKDQLGSKNTSISKLRTIGRQFKEKLEAAEKELTKIKGESTGHEAEISALKKQLTSGVSTSEEVPSGGSEVEDLKERLRQADELVSESAAKINELEEQLGSVGGGSSKKVEDIEKEIQEIQEASVKKEERARNVLKNAREKILRLESTNSSLENKISSMKSSELAQTLKDSYESQIDALRSEKEKLQARIKKLIQESMKKPEVIEAVGSGSGPPPSPVASSNNNPPVSSPTADVQTLSVKPMKSAQPQAHIQPTRQKVSVQPMRMHGAAVRAPPAPSEVRQVSVQPTILSVSPNEFTPRQIHEEDDGSTTPTALVVPRGYSSTSEDQPSTSTASVPPTPKRPRDEDDPCEEDPTSKKVPKVAVPPSEQDEEEGGGDEDVQQQVVVLDEEEEIMEEMQEEDEIPEEEEEGCEEEEDEDINEEEVLEEEEECLNLGDEDEVVEVDSDEEQVVVVEGRTVSQEDFEASSNEVVFAETGEESTEAPFVFSAPQEAAASHEEDLPQETSTPNTTNAASIAAISFSEPESLEGVEMEESSTLPSSSTIPTSDRPRISRAPIVWNSPPSVPVVDSSSSSSGFSGGPSGASAPMLLRGSRTTRKPRGRRGGSFNRGGGGPFMKAAPPGSGGGTGNI